MKLKIDTEQNYDLMFMMSGDIYHNIKGRIKIVRDMYGFRWVGNGWINGNGDTLEAIFCKKLRGMGSVCDYEGNILILTSKNTGLLSDMHNVLHGTGTKLIDRTKYAKIKVLVDDMPVDFSVDTR